jgi:hypothetical protein
MRGDSYAHYSIINKDGKFNNAAINIGSPKVIINIDNNG